MTLGQVVIAASALGVLLLSVAVARLSRQVAELARFVGHRQTAPEPAPGVARSPEAPAEPLLASQSLALERPSVRPRGRHEGDEGDRAVAFRVITRLDGEPDHDLTTARIASVTLGGPLIKVAAFAHGVRRALREEHRMRVAYVVRKEMRRQRRTRRRARAERAAGQGSRP